MEVEKSRIVLSTVQAREIYKCKLELLRPNTTESCSDLGLKGIVLKLRGQSAPVAECFGVSPKTVRDVWNRRTWAHATHDMWGHESDHRPSVEVRLSLSMRQIIVLIKFLLGAFPECDESSAHFRLLTFFCQCSGSLFFKKKIRST